MHCDTSKNVSGRLHKGIRQALEIKPVEPKKREATELSNHLCRQYKKGRLNAREIGDIVASTCPSKDTFEAKLSVAKGNHKLGSHSASRDSSRDLSRCIAPNLRLHPLYYAKTPMWNEHTLKMEEEKQAYLPPHEMLDALVQQGSEDQWCKLGSHQAGIRQDLKAWADRLQIKLDDEKVACLSLWGDSAPHTHRDSIYLLLFSVVSGVIKRRLWVTALNKKSLQMRMLWQMFF